MKQQAEPYHISELDTKGRRVKLRVLMTDPDDVKGWAPAAPEYLVEDMARWCEETGCGRRTAYDMFEFPSEEAAMMFRLRWV